MTKRFFLDSDDDGHWYLVEAESRRDWNRWIEQVYSDDEMDDISTPKYATELGTHPHFVEFENPEVT